MIRISVDTGGTFTDLVRLDVNGLTVHKVRSTPEDPARAIIAGIAVMAERKLITEVIHGSTVATNAILERKGARVALLITKGFEDVLLIGRQARNELYNFMVRGNREMIAPGFTFGLTERIDHLGNILEPLRPAELSEITKKLRKAEVECVAVCLLHSYVNPTHELEVTDYLEKAGFVVSTSYRILPEYREYERCSTTVVNAYVTPIMSHYLSTLEREFGPTRLHVMQSNGGSISATQAKNNAVRTILSGPAAGAIGAQAMAEASGFDRVILFDMGGTSTDVSLCDKGLSVTSEATVGDFPVRLPMLDIHTVGAGGGSIAYVDTGGSLRVGPRSAGADPGPACYGKGIELTVTDANLVLGRLDPDHFLGGRMQLDVQHATRCAEEFAQKLDMDFTRLAEGIVRIANANMERAIRAVSVQRGNDPRDFALLAFGGAGGMHACEIADMLEIKTVLIPKYAGVLSALGMLLADVRKDYSQTILRLSDSLDFEILESLLAPLVERAYSEVAAEGFAEHDVVVDRLLDMRYQGQAYEIAVPFTPEFNDSFSERHQLLYGYSNSTRATEIVNIRVNAAGITQKHLFPAADVAPRPLTSAIETRPVWFERRWWDTAIFHQETMEPGSEGDGPAIITGGQSTIVITPNFSFRIDGVGTLIATREVKEK
jgi:N-methylhydantoinase A/oxoprolinase/acetone carboxylase beta subunit